MKHELFTQSVRGCHVTVFFVFVQFVVFVVPEAITAN